MTKKICVALVLGVIVFVAPAISEEDVTGVWSGPFEIGHHRGTMTLRLVQNGETITGSVVNFSDDGDQDVKIDYTVSGKIKNGKMTLYIGELVLVVRLRGPGGMFQGSISGHMNKSGQVSLSKI